MHAWFTNILFYYLSVMHGFGSIICCLACLICQSMCNGKVLAIYGLCARVMWESDREGKKSQNVFGDLIFAIIFKWQHSGIFRQFLSLFIMIGKDLKFHSHYYINCIVNGCASFSHCVLCFAFVLVSNAHVSVHSMSMYVCVCVVVIFKMPWRLSVRFTL